MHRDIKGANVLVDAEGVCKRTLTLTLTLTLPLPLPLPLTPHPHPPPHPHQVRHRAAEMDLHEEDWMAFLAGAKQRTYAPGEYVLQEGKPTAALYQIVRGTLRVELQLPDQPQAVVVGYRKPGEMFGETSLLQSGVATASIAADSEATLTRLNTPNPSPYP